MGYLDLRGPGWAMKATLEARGDEFNVFDTFDVIDSVSGFSGAGGLAGVRVVHGKVAADGEVVAERFDVFDIVFANCVVLAGGDVVGFDDCHALFELLHRGLVEAFGQGPFLLRNARAVEYELDDAQHGLLGWAPDGEFLGFKGLADFILNGHRKLPRTRIAAGRSETGNSEWYVIDCRGDGVLKPT